MGCYCPKQQLSSVQSSKYSILEQENNSSLQIDQTKNDIHFFLQMPLIEIKKYLKHLSEAQLTAIKEEEIKYYKKILMIFENIVKKLQEAQNNSLVGIDSDLLGQSSYNQSNNMSQNTYRQDMNGNLEQVNQQRGQNRSQFSGQKQNKRQNLKYKIDQVVMKRDLYINLKQPELKLQVISCSISYMDKLFTFQTCQTNSGFSNSNITQNSSSYSEKSQNLPKQIYSVQLKISVYHNDILMEGLQLQHKCMKPSTNHPMNLQDVNFKIEKFLSFLFASKQQSMSDADYYKNSYILFEILTKQNKKSQYIKEKEQKISLEEFLSQNLVFKTFRFFKDEDMNDNSLITKFDLELRAQLICDSRQYLKQIMKETNCQIEALNQNNHNYQKKKKQIETRQNAQQNRLEQNNLNQTPEQPNTTPYDIFQYFTDIQGPTPMNASKTPRSQMFIHNNSQNINDLNENQSRVSLEYLESYSCQYNNRFAMQEEEDEHDQQNEVIELGQNNDDSDNNTELLQNSNQRNEMNFNRQLIESTSSQDGQKDADIQALREQISQSQQLTSSPMYRLNDSILRIQQCPIIEAIEQDEKSSIEDFDQSSEVFPNENH